jgi:hypothetical protein
LVGRSLAFHRIAVFGIGGGFGGGAFATLLSVLVLAVLVFAFGILSFAFSSDVLSVLVACARWVQHGG